MSERHKPAPQPEGERPPGPDAQTGAHCPTEENLRRYMGNDEFARICNIELVTASPGYAKARMTIGQRHLNGFGIVQGGAIFTLADFAFAAASNAHGTVTVGVSTNMTFMKAAVSGTLWAEAQENSRNPKLCSYTVRVTDDHGDLIGIFQGMAYRKRDPLPVIRPGARS